VAIVVIFGELFGLFLANYFLKEKQRICESLFFLENISSKNYKNLPQKNHWDSNSEKYANFFKKKKTLLLTLSTYLPTYLLTDLST